MIPSRAETASDASVSTSVPVKMLVVDDCQESLVSMQALLARPGLVVLIANSALTALELLSRHEVALALLDVQMPEVNGFELAERMRRNAETSSVPIIFMTGDGGVQTRTFLGYEAGAVDFLIKPVDPKMLESKVRVFVALYRQRRELWERNATLEHLLRLNDEMTEALRQAHSQAVQEAQTDSLTGVASRRRILQLGDATLNDRRHKAQPLSLAILDLDHFKAVNDTHGHHVGDAVLSAFCRHVSQRIRPPHMLGRLGGEEFLLLMPGTSLADAEIVLERVRRTLEPHGPVRYTFSAGIVEAAAGESLPGILKRADGALYEAKDNGRDCSVMRPATQ